MARIIGDNNDNRLIGTLDAELIRGLDGSDRIRARGGDDTVQAGDGDDNVRGQGGNDTLKGNGGDDTLNGNGGDDRIIGGSGDDRINGGSGDDTLSGGSGDDRIQGGDDDDLLRGGAGDDLLIGDTGTDTMRGGAGNDRMVWNNGDGSDDINGGAGFDVTQVNGADGAGDEFDLQQVDGQAIFNRLNLGLFTLTNEEIEQFEINSLGGDDSFTVGDLSGSEVQSVVFSGGDGNDTLDARETSTTIEAFGGDGDDLLLGGSAIDTFFAGAGDDIVVGQRGDDIADLEDGDDRFIWNNGDGSDDINGGAGFDVTQVNGADGAGDEFDLQQVDGQAIFNRLNLGLFTLTNEEIEQFEINGQDGDDSLTVGDLTGSAVQSVVFSGGDGNDFLNASGTLTPVTADGGDGDDILIGGGGDNLLIGGGGNDILINNGDGDGGGGGGDFTVGFDTGAAFNAADIGIDQIQNFGVTDSIVLDVTVFTELTSDIGGALSASEFAVVNSVEEAALSDALIVYGANSGDLYYNANGTEAGFGDGAQFATIQGAPELDATNFVIQA